MTRIHISLQTAHLDESVAFYDALFGCPPDKRRDNYARFQPDNAPIALAIMPGEPAPGPHHMGLKVGSSAQAKQTWERLVAAGLDVRTELDTTCCWAVQNKAWVSDPDGREWEIYAVTDDAPATQDGQESRSCCV